MNLQPVALLWVKIGRTPMAGDHRLGAVRQFEQQGGGIIHR